MTRPTGGACGACSCENVPETPDLGLTKLSCLPGGAGGGVASFGETVAATGDGDSLGV